MENKNQFEEVFEFSQIQDERERVAMLENNCIRREDGESYEVPLTEEQIEHFRESEMESFNKIMQISDEIKELNSQKKEHTEVHKEAHQVLKKGTISEYGSLYVVEDSENEGFELKINSKGIVIARIKKQGGMRRMQFNKAV